MSKESIARGITTNVSYHQSPIYFAFLFSLLEDENRLSRPSMLQDFRVKCWTCQKMHTIASSLFIYICTASKETVESDRRDLSSRKDILSTWTFDSCAAGVLHDHHYLLQASRNVQHRIDGWPGMGAALEEHPVQQVQGLSSSKQKGAVSQVGTTFGKVSDGKKRKERKGKKMEETETRISFVLRSFFRLLLQILTKLSVSLIISSSSIQRFSTKFNRTI